MQAQKRNKKCSQPNERRKNNMTPCYLALGSNLNHPKKQIELAIQALHKIPASRVIKIAPLYQSKPAYDMVQPMYYNTVLLLQTNLSPQTLFKHCREIETNQKRCRLKRFGPRTIDIDILLYGEESIQTPDLTIPHPRMHLRDFVLIPLLQLWPDAKLPNGQLLRENLEQIKSHIVSSKQ